MAQHGLDRANIERVAVIMRYVVARVEEGLADGLGLFGITRGGAGAVRLEVLAAMAGVPGVQPGLCVRLLDEVDLRRGIRHGDALGSAVLVDAGLSDDAFDFVSVCDCSAESSAIM
jgi:hypothetical protein